MFGMFQGKFRLTAADYLRVVYTIIGIAAVVFQTSVCIYVLGSDQIAQKELPMGDYGNIKNQQEVCGYIGSIIDKYPGNEIVFDEYDPVYYVTLTNSKKIMLVRTPIDSSTDTALNEIMENGFGRYHYSGVVQKMSEATQTTVMAHFNGSEKLKEYGVDSDRTEINSYVVDGILDIHEYHDDKSNYKVIIPVSILAILVIFTVVMAWGLVRNLRRGLRERSGKPVDYVERVVTEDDINKDFDGYYDGYENILERPEPEKKEPAEKPLSKKEQRREKIIHDILNPELFDDVRRLRAKVKKDPGLLPPEPYKKPEPKQEPMFYTGEPEESEELLDNTDVTAERDKKNNSFNLRNKY